MKVRTALGCLAIANVGGIACGTDARLGTQDAASTLAPEADAAGSDAGTSPDVPSTDGVVPPDVAIATAPRVGSVTVIQTTVTVDHMDVVSTGIIAVFGSDETQGGRCTAQTLSGCRVITCRASPTGGSPASAAPPSAGTIRLTSGSESLEVAPATDGTYATIVSMKRLWSPAAMVSVAASGGTVPAFAGRVTGFDAITITAPVHSPTGERFVLPRSGSLPLAWMGMTGTVSVSLWARDQTKIVSARCSLAGASNSGSIGSVVLSKFPAGDASISVTAGDEQTITAGDYRLTFTALGGANSPDETVPPSKYPFYFEVTLQ